MSDINSFFILKKGLTSNLASIQTSRLSTYLHQTSPPGKLPKDNQRACVQPFAVYFGNGEQIYF
jgi:cation transporter-like permease